MTGLILLTIIIAFVAIFFINLFVPTVAIATDTTTTISYDTAKANQNNATIVDMYCASLQLSSFSKADILTLCTDYLSRYALQTGIKVLIAVIIVLINFILRILVSVYANIRRYKGYSQLIKAKTTSLFLAMFLNIFVLTIVLHSDFFGFSFTGSTTNLLSNTSLSQYVGNLNVYQDLQRVWYIEVGSQISQIWIISTLFSPHLIQLLLVPIISCWRSMKAKDAQVQIDMNVNYIGTEYQLNIYLADVFQFMCISFLLSAAMPHMVILGFIGMVLKFWVYKYLLLRFSKRPPTLDHRTLKTTFLIIPLTLIFHLCFSIWVFGYPGIFPVQSSLVYQPVKNLISSTSQSTTSVLQIFENSIFLNTLFTRCLTQILFTSLLALIILYYLVKFIIFNVLAFVLKMFCGNKQQDSEPPYQYSYQKVLDKIQGNMICSYDILKNPDYAAAAYSIDASVISI